MPDQHTSIRTSPFAATAPLGGTGLDPRSPPPLRRRLRGRAEAQPAASLGLRPLESLAAPLAGGVGLVTRSRSSPSTRAPSSWSTSALVRHTPSPMPPARSPCPRRRWLAVASRPTARSSSIAAAPTRRRASAPPAHSPASSTSPTSSSSRAVSTPSPPPTAPSPAPPPIRPLPTRAAVAQPTPRLQALGGQHGGGAHGTGAEGARGREPIFGSRWRKAAPA